MSQASTPTAQFIHRVSYKHDSQKHPKGGKKQIKESRDHCKLDNLIFLFSCYYTPLSSYNSSSYRDISIHNTEDGNRCVKRVIRPAAAPIEAVAGSFPKPTRRGRSRGRPEGSAESSECTTKAAGFGLSSGLFCKYCIMQGDDDICANSG